VAVVADPDELRPGRELGERGRGGVSGAGESGPGVRRAAAFLREPLLIQQKVGGVVQGAFRDRVARGVTDDAARPVNLRQRSPRRRATCRGHRSGPGVDVSPQPDRHRTRDAQLSGAAARPRDKCWISRDFESWYSECQSPAAGSPLNAAASKHAPYSSASVAYGSWITGTSVSSDSGDGRYT
jgi:hypothetical protein